LKAWARQTNKAGGTLLLRGFHENSIGKTSAKVRTLLGEQTLAEFQVDPEAFHRFQVSMVPSVVVVNEQNHFHVVSGDISLESALEKILNKGTYGMREVTQEYLARSRG
jgi:type-F conjugative transfer system pilin assembly protein TrbC